MDTREFLEAVWPAAGIYCLATPFRSTYRHKTFTSITAFCDEVSRLRGTDNIFFCVHTLKRKSVWNDDKMAYDPDQVRTKPDGSMHTGSYGAYEVRTHDNMLECKTFFFDLDVGESTPTLHKYSTQQEALDGLEAFLFHTGLPTPLVTSSGGGYHVYWPLDAAIPSIDWRNHAAKLYHAARRLGLRVDPSRTTDQSSVLRVVGTSNLKPGREPRDCVAVQAGVTTSVQAFSEQLTELVGSDFVPTLQSARAPRHHVIRDNLTRVWDGPVRTLDEVAEVCEHVRTYRENGYQEGGYVKFYNVGCGIVPYVENGENLSLELALKHPRCTEEYAERGVASWKHRAGGPASCKKLDEKCGGDACERCPFSALGKNPLLIATEKLRVERLPPKTVEQSALPPEPVCDPPKPYKRKDGKILKTAYKVVKDIEIEEDIVVCPYDIFPFDMVARTPAEHAFNMWALKIPHKSDLVQIKVTAPMMTELKTLQTEFGTSGVHLSGSQFKETSALMQYWLQELQKKIDTNRQFDHLGWVDDSVKEFIMPDKVYNIDGTCTPSTLSAVAKSSMGAVHKRGSPEASIKAMEFYNRPEYIRHQFMMMLALGAPMFHATGHAGCVVNAWGESGGSKSTVLYGGASLWGHPERYTVNGTNAGATAMARAEQIFTFSNLPVCVDEITKMSNDDVDTFVYNATQREPKRRLNPDGSQKPIKVQWKSTPLLCSSNTSLNNVISSASMAGLAANMRVFEIFFHELDESHKAAAGAFMREINKHYGHIGPEFLTLYMRQREELDTAQVALIDTLSVNLKMGAAERFWTDCMANGLLTGHIAYQAGLLPFKIEPVREWLFSEQLDEMRKHIKSEKTASDPLSLLGSFLNDKAAQIIVVLPPDREGKCYTQRDPQGSIVAHYDMATGQIHVRKDEFRKWCDARKQFGLRTIQELARKNHIYHLDRKHILGKGTSYATGQSICFTINLADKEVSGIVGPKIVPIRSTTALKEVNK